MTTSPPAEPGHPDAVRRGYLADDGPAILTHVHGGRAGHGVAALIVAPFGWDEVCSHRARLELARRLAADGVPALRFDAPGVGDSEGDDAVPGRLAAWVDATARAAHALRASTGARAVAAVGIGLGGLVAAEAVAAGAPLDALVLWPAITRGRAVVRELVAMRRLELQEYSDARTADDGTVAGFPLPAAFSEDVSAVDLTRTIERAGARFEGLPVLAMGRDEIPPDEPVVTALGQAGARVECAPGDGYSAMMGDPLTSRMDDGAAERIVAFCRSAVPRPAAAPAAADVPAPASTALVEPGVVEEPVQFEAPAGTRLFGVWSRPADGPATDARVTVFLNAGAVRHTGPNRMWVRAARRLARLGHASLRVDLAGIGESDGTSATEGGEPGLHTDALAAQALGAVEAALAAGGDRAAVVGLCSGACWGTRAAGADTRIDRAVLINPRYIFWDDALSAERETANAATSVLRRSAWRKLARGDVTAARAMQVIRASVVRLVRSLSPSGHPTTPGEVESALRRLDRPELDAVFVFTEGEPLLGEFERDGLLPPPGMTRPFTVVRLHDAGHTLRPRWAQDRLVDLVVERVTAPGPGEA